MKDIKKFCQESNCIEGIEDEKADAQMEKAYDWLMQWSELDPSIIEQLHKVMLTGLEDNEVVWNPGPEMPTGKYRTYDIRVGLWHGPSWMRLPELISDWCYIYGSGKGLSEEQCLESHVKYEGIHPFGDGNGRTGRLLMAWAYEKNGFEPPLFLNEEKFEKYYPLFESN